MWVTFVYFAVFVVTRSFGLERSFFQFKQANGLTESSFTLAPVVGAIICFAAAVIVYANQFAVVRLQERMYPGNMEAVEEDADDTKSGESQTTEQA